MNNKLLSKSLVFTAISFIATTVNAQSVDFPVSFRTISDVEIQQVQALSFGATMFSANGGTCSMDASGTTINDADAAILRGTPVSGSLAGAVTGTGCIDTAAGISGNQIGIYRVIGISGSDVQITVNEVTGSDFTYTPDSGCISNYDGATAGDTCQSFFVSSPTTTALADATDGADANVTEGELRIVIGGKITINTDLTADTNYSQDFTIDAIY
ncbi:hypothetical protein Q4506_07425 [Colwellia sp. 4_MG-2023]|jgi:hypothetical protein|uniref:hypothetical protein n=1 Tax=unclassified Colwellia TaxID=196834 RepID=UPI001C0A3D16|nr:MULTISPECIES: hypothetical protein [unclassified Colwellia]MBU2923208.1 hypothetical protein [Colwellia sp. C2M11]MDO6486611.1 hypothetical protein [Colwellia sp. 6_MG-2023]MDO6506681.1 hypothetical protein [Colwellia sp. 5_MG-2023]MDO6555507.1 hypothetical protein [Colwellia sp. 4_MG-2023]MDO6651362.1 hypothetical protein [Colwellia sp. 3_MG-2023]